VSPSTFPSFRSDSRFSPLLSTLALPVTLAPSCLSVKVYFCSPRWVSNSAFHVPATSAARADSGRAASTTNRIRVFMACARWFGGFEAGSDQNQTHSVLEQQRRKVVQTAPPSEPFMGRLRRYEEMRVNARFLESFSIRFGVAANTAAAAATAGT